MRITRIVLSIVLLALALATPALARVASIETTAPLADQSEDSIKAALEQAVSTAVRGAVAMGFSWVHVRQAVVFTDLVSVQMLASDKELRSEDEAAADPAPEEDAEPPRPARIDI
jgi:sulfite exporter TauE/SafE